MMYILCFPHHEFGILGFWDFANIHASAPPPLSPSPPPPPPRGGPVGQANNITAKTRKGQKIAYQHTCIFVCFTFVNGSSKF